MNKNDDKNPKITKTPDALKSPRRQKLDESYNKTMKQVQLSMTPIESLFSRCIHNVIIEKISYILSDTIFRPNLLLLGSILAFVFSLTTYASAKIIGYPLSGFEITISFLIGWIIGILYDYIKIVITGKK